MSIFESIFYTGDVSTITIDDITRINNMITSNKVHCVILNSAEDGLLKIVIRYAYGLCTCYIDGYFSNFKLFGEYYCLDIVGIQTDEFIDYGKPKKVVYSPYISEEHQKYLYKNYNVVNILYYPGIIVKPSCMIMYNFSLNSCKHFIKNFPKDVHKLELLVSSDMFNLKNKKMFDKVMKHIATFPNLKLLWIQNIMLFKIKYNFKSIMYIGSSRISDKFTIKTRGIDNKYIFKNPYVTKIVTDCEPNKVLKYIQKNTTLKQLKLCDCDWDIIQLPEELQYFIDRNNQATKSARN